MENVAIPKPRQRPGSGIPGFDFTENDTFSFIIRIWFEETVEEDGRATWRGHITHVPSGKRRYVTDVEGITAFIVTYLEDRGVELGLRGRLKRWMNRLML